MKRVIAVLLLAAAGCAGGASRVMPVPAASDAPSSAATSTLTVAIAGPATAAGTVRHPAYVNGSAVGLRLTVDNNSPQTAMFAHGSLSECARYPTPGFGYVCVVTFVVFSGQHTLTLALLAPSYAAQSVISSAIVAKNFLPGTTTNLAVTLSGVPREAILTIYPSYFTPGQSGSLPIAVSFLDSAGAVIMTPGAYADDNGNPLTFTFTNSDTSGATAIAPSQIDTPGQTATLTYSGGTAPAGNALSVGVTGGTLTKQTVSAAPVTFGAQHVFINGFGSISEFASLNGTLIRTVNAPNTSLLAVDGSGTIFAAEAYAVDVFAPASALQTRVLTLAPSPAPTVGALAAAPDGTAYVATGNSISVFRPGSTAPSEVWSGSNTGLLDVRGLAVDPSGLVYALNNGNATVTVHPANAHGAPARTLPLRDPIASYCTGGYTATGLTVAAGNVFAAVADGPGNTCGRQLSFEWFGPADVTANLASSPMLSPSNAGITQYAQLAADAAGFVYTVTGASHVEQPPCGRVGCSTYGDGAFVFRQPAPVNGAWGAYANSRTSPSNGIAIGP